MNCPNCRATIPIQNINIQTDIGKCDACGSIFKVSDAFTELNPRFDINQTPAGAWYRQNFSQTTIGATTRSYAAFFLVPFMIVWSGGSLGGIYGTQIISGEFNPFMSLFGIPFLIGSVVFWSLALMAIWGKVELTFNHQGGTIFTGLGKIGITKHFQWNEISKIDEGSSNHRYPGGHGAQIVLKKKKRYSFGSGLNEERRYYLLQALKKIQAQIGPR